MHLVLTSLSLFTNTHIKLVIGRESLLQWEKALTLAHCLHLDESGKKIRRQLNRKQQWNQDCIFFLRVSMDFSSISSKATAIKNISITHPHCQNSLQSCPLYILKKCPLFCRHNRHSPYLHDYHDITVDQTLSACQTQGQTSCADQRSWPYPTEWCRWLHCMD